MRRKLIRIPESLYSKLLQIKDWTELSTMQTIIVDVMNRGAKWYLKQIEAEKKAARAIPNATDQDQQNYKPKPSGLQEPDLDELIKIAQTPWVNTDN